ncbi:MAG TPA: ATP-binding protein [Solirubrobacteraceae bacterium]|nr:ATP-binding protein [Solirubrobacteraceae bacterium]
MRPHGGSPHNNAARPAGQAPGSASACPFGLCDGSGFIDDEELRAVRACRCRDQLVARGRARSLSAVIPRKYRGVSFDRPPVSTIHEPLVRPVRQFVRHLDDRLAAGRGLWFEGSVGTGKTTLAMLVSKSAIEAGRTVAIYSLPRLLAEIRQTFESGVPGAYVDFLARLEDVDLLHVDDVGAERTSPWVLEQLYAIVNARYEAERSIVITTNLERDALVEQITERTVSRLEEMCEVIPLFGADARLRAAPDLRSA